MQEVDVESEEAAGNRADFILTEDDIEAAWNGI